MNQFVDLSHPLSDGMPGFRMRGPDGEETEYTAEIESFLTHEESKPLYDGQASFEITEIRFQTSIGTYLDAPFHRFPDGQDVSELSIDELVRPGIVVDVRGREPHEAVGPEVLPDSSIAGKAVLFHFGWDRYWNTESYRSYPYISTNLVDRLLDEDVSLVGVDTINIDDDGNPSRPAHTRLLDEDVFIVENLRNLHTLLEAAFRFFAVPLKVEGAAAMPIRAFGERLS